MNVPEFGRNGEVIADTQVGPAQASGDPCLKRRNYFATRLVLVFLLSGPFNPVGLVAALFFLRGGFDAALGVACVVNAYCGVAALIGLVMVALSKRPWTADRLVGLSLLIMLFLYIASALVAVLHEPILIWIYFVYGLFIAMLLGAPAAFIGASYAQIILFEKSRS